MYNICSSPCSRKALSWSSWRWSWARVPNPVSCVREKNEDRTGNRPYDRWHGHQQNLLRGLERRVEALHRVRVQKGHSRKHDQREKCMNKVPKPKPISQKILRGRWRRIRPKALSSCNAIVCLPLAIGIAIGERGEAAREAANGDQDARWVLVDGVAMAIVG